MGAMVCRRNVVITLPEISVYTLLDRSAKKFPDHTAIIFEDHLMDYKSLKSQVDKLAGKWKEMGFVKGERIGLMMANHPYFYHQLLRCTSAGTHCCSTEPYV